LAEQVKIMERCVGHGAAAVAWAQAVRTHPLAVLTAAKSLMAAGHRLACAEAGFSAILDGDTATATDTLAAKRRWTALIGLESTLLSQRRAAEAAARLDASIARGEGGSSLFLVGAGIVPELEDRGRAVAQADAKTFGPSYGNCPYPIRLWALALWEAHAGSPTVVAAVARNLEGQARASGARGDYLLAHSAAAYSALARGDTSGALARLSALVPNAPPGPYLEWDIAEPLGYERLTYARLLLATGRAQQALETASVFDSSLPIVYVAFLPASLELRAEAATALGRADLAAHYRERLAALRPEKLTALR
jgi:hypothetical protein